jgi:hypothetical protein
VLGAAQHVARLVLAGARREAEDASLVVALTLHVAHAPGRPQALLGHAVTVLGRAHTLPCVSAHPLVVAARSIIVRDARVLDAAAAVPRVS